MVTVDAGGYEIGPNPSEDTETGADDQPDIVKRVINIVEIHQLQEVFFDKVTFISWLRKYIKRVVGYLEKKDPERASVFESAIQEFARVRILPNFDELSFWSGASMDPNAGVVFSFCAEDSLDPTFWFLKDGLNVETI